MKLGKYSMGIGDRFNHQGKAQLKALRKAREAGIEIIPVWNKSNREHQIMNSTPEQTRREADKTIQMLNWDLPYFVDADHIDLFSVNRFIDYCDFYTIDVAEYIGKPPVEEDVEDYIEENRKFIGKLSIPGLNEDFNITENTLAEYASKFLNAIQEAGKIYRYIHKRRAGREFITEISLDEFNDPQSQVELFFILGSIAAEKIPLQTISLKFPGRFNKGVDYKGNPDLFEREFEKDLLVIDFAIKTFNLPENLKLSIHSGSDKFSIYPIIGELIRKYDKGIHIKTAGTTWLEEITGLAISGDEGLAVVKSIYRSAYLRKEELCKPYTTVIEIDHSRLPTPESVDNWNSQKFADSLRHIPGHPDFNPDFRQLIHIAYKIAAELGNTYLQLLEKYTDIISENVTENLYERHIKRLFPI